MAAQGNIFPRDFDEIQQNLDEIDRDYFNLAIRDVDNSDSENSGDDIDSDTEDNGNMHEHVDVIDVNHHDGAGAENNPVDADAQVPVGGQMPQSLKLRAQCTCQAACIDAFSSDSVEMGRSISLSLTKESHDYVLLGKISTSINRTAETKCTKRSNQTERKRPRTIYTHEGKATVSM